MRGTRRLTAAEKARRAERGRVDSEEHLRARLLARAAWMEPPNWRVLAKSWHVDGT